MTTPVDARKPQWANLAPQHGHGHSFQAAPLARHYSFFYDEPDLETSSARTEILRELRSERLIGVSVPLADWESSYKTVKQISGMSSGLRSYYESQNEQLEKFQEVDALLDSGISQSLIEEYGDDIGVDRPRHRQPAPQTINIRRAHEALAHPGVIRFWINVNMLANFVLLLGKVVVFLLTDSLSVVASLIDSVLDMLSTLIIWISASVADRRDWKTKHLYPVGRTRLEPIGVLVFSVIMVVSFLKVGNEAIGKLLGGATEPVKIGTPSLIIMLFTVVVKIGLWVCIRNVNSSSVQALAQDAVTDIVFNTFSIIFPVVGFFFDLWWLDPLGALILSCYVVWSWGSIAMEHIDNLIGSAASPQDRQQLLYLCMRFSDKIEYITGLNAYHAGDRLMCEVDILLDKKLTLRDSHDLAESLQYALESLPTVERAFVHLDYRRENFTGHVER